MSIELERGSVHAVIGTNGAGKSTLINMLSGEIPPSGGQVELLGQDVTALDAAQARARRPGPQLPAQHHLPELHACSRTAASPRRRARRSPGAGGSDAQRCEASTAAAQAAAARAGLDDLLDRAGRACSRTARSASSRSRCAWPPQPEVLLLDEPLAGMGAEETERMLALLAELQAGHAILLVEHDMDAVFRIADRITVMVNGAVIASRHARQRCAPAPKCRRPTWEAH